MSRNEKTYRNGVKVSEGHGAAEWRAERLSALVLIPLSLWGLWGAWTIAGSGYDGARAWLAQPINAALLTGETSPELLGVMRASRWPVLVKPVGLENLQALMRRAAAGLD